ncbi:ammonia-forming cytochrome c nitrite reductase subunit c552 [Shewanella sp. 3_MG-2023]|uniref:ammonia-forming cytochrome c nitrite reductase subunit c552 n=1 Tax=Shewanella sp. 3_MG-2023 TaxID=3062635 RepID=UPI0026E1B67F|nr:ammonia-forming cytochrome c nitrite reductase subunit c552 [Shewanella sp. 3_MG-2023]MDO6776552.1 ammonia-forming cytochrome c nitrite reductase subunit c552 [Shewanella sp. 3_MG-2023]
MMKLQKLALAVMVSAVFTGTAVAKDVDLYKSENWQQTFPEQYKTWAETEQSTPASGELDDLLAANPNLVSAWAGYGFAKDYNRARGHHYALTDIIETLRVGHPVVGHDGKVVGEAMAASCWSCKSPDVARMYDEVGEGKFSDNAWSTWGHEMSNTIGCADCHELGKEELRLSRPYTDRAMKTIGKDFAKQDSTMQASQTCAQCHVEYYFDGTDSKKVKYPTDYWVPGVETDYKKFVNYTGTDGLYLGFAAEAQLAYFDQRGFKDWTNAVSGAPMIKAQHPEFENMLDRTEHAMDDHLEFGCTTCHMPKATNAKGAEFSNHKVTFEADKLPADCQSCHEAGDFKEILDERKAEITKLRFDANGTDPRLTEVHFKAQAIWAANGIKGLEAGQTISQAKGNYEAALKAKTPLAGEMNSLLTKVRNAQWFWDSATASHGIHAHNPTEAVRLLEKSNSILDAALTEANALLAKYAPSYKYDATKYDTKAKVQPLVGLDLEAMQASKEIFLDKRVKKEWPAELK